MRIIKLACQCESSGTGWLGLLSGALWATMFTCFMLALTLTTTGRTLVAGSLAPFFTAVLARVWLNERVARRTWFAIAIATIGMAVMFRGGLAAGGSNVAGTLVALGVPLASAVNVNAMRRFHASIDLLPAVLIGAALSALVALPLAVPFEATTRDLSLLATLGVFQLGIPCMVIVVASRHLSAVEISLLLLIEVVLGPLWSWLGAGEMPARATLAGGALVLAALLADQLLAPRAPRPAPGPRRWRWRRAEPGYRSHSKCRGGSSRACPAAKRAIPTDCTLRRT